MAFDFPNAQLPQLTPIRQSFTVDEVEADIKQVFIDLFEQYLASAVFDTNVLGMAHLGSLDLVKRVINADGLVVLPSPYQEASARYVYRAWKSRDKHGRGLYFLKTYLQCLFPGAWSVEQQMAPIDQVAHPYPTALYDRSTHGDDADKFLTSRVHIKLDASVIPSVAGLVPIISAIIPARFIPKLFTVLFTNSGTQIASIAHAQLKFHGSGTVTAPAVKYPDASSVMVSVGNPSIRLHGSGTVSR